MPGDRITPIGIAFSPLHATSRKPLHETPCTPTGHPRHYSGGGVGRGGLVGPGGYGRYAPVRSPRLQASGFAGDCA